MCSEDEYRIIEDAAVGDGRAGDGGRRDMNVGDIRKEECRQQQR